MDFGQDFGAFGFPHVALGRELTRGEIGLHRADEFAHRSKAGFSNDILGQIAEKTFHEIHPGTARGGEVEVEAGMGRKPFFHFGVLVRGVIVDDEM